MKLLNVLPQTVLASSLNIFGISFYSLQIFSYLMDVRWSRTVPEMSFLRFFSYTAFFGNFISGPLERAQSFICQLDLPFKLTQFIFVDALMYIVLGLFKKYILAENLAVYTIGVFKQHELYTGVPVAIAILLSKFYLFYDLSGYSDIVVGISKLYGFELTKNFNRPLFSTNLGDFWKRWHISVSTWIRDYIFLPLLSTRLAPLGVGALLTVSFVLFGLWHGLTWTFLSYGFLQALFLIIAPKMQALKIVSLGPSKASKVLRWILFYSLLLAIPSVLFFSNSMKTFFYIIQSLLRSGGLSLDKFLNLGAIYLPGLLFLVIVFEVASYKLFSFNWAGWFISRSYLTKHFIILIAVMVFIAFARINSQVNFVYWNF